MSLCFLTETTRRSPCDDDFCLFVGAGTRARSQEETGESGELSEAGGGEIKRGKKKIKKKRN